MGKEGRPSCSGWGNLKVKEHVCNVTHTPLRRRWWFVAAAEDESLCSMTGNSQRSPKGEVNLTKSLIVQRNLSIPRDKQTPESICQALTSLQVLRLDRENIKHITSMQGLEQIHSIYLQQNHIQKIENLSSFPNLKFLSLAGNCISEVENLRSLTKLQFLDLSQNCIETLDTDELPQNLVVLDLTGNKCTKQDGYRERVWAALPHLKRLDAKDIPIQKAPIQKKKEEEEEDSSEDTDYEDWPEFSRPLSAEKDFFVGLHSEFTSRSARRQEEAIKEHEARLEELKQQQKLRQLVFNTSQSSSEVQGGSEPATPALEDNIPQTEQHTVSNSLSEATNPTFQIRPSTLKGKAEGASSAQGKNPKEKVPSSTKTTIKRVNK